MEKAPKNKLWRTLYSCRLATLGCANVVILLEDAPFWRERNSAALGSILFPRKPFPNWLPEDPSRTQDQSGQQELRFECQPWVRSTRHVLANGCNPLSLGWASFDCHFRNCVCIIPREDAFLPLNLHWNTEPPSPSVSWTWIWFIAPLSGQWCLLLAVLPTVVAG